MLDRPIEISLTQKCFFIDNVIVVQRVANAYVTPTEESAGVNINSHSAFSESNPITLECNGCIRNQCRLLVLLNLEIT